MSSSHHVTLTSLVPPPPHTGTRFPALDTLRAVGALSVLTTHAAFWAGDYTRYGVVGTVLARLDIGVAIFFVLSGFLLARPWLASAADGAPAPRTADYLWKRLWRIAPVYVVAVVLALALLDANRGASVLDWARTLLMLDTFVGVGLPAGLTQMWSLAVEVTFYLVLPALMVVVVGRRRRLRPRRVLAWLAVLVGITVWWHLDGIARAGDLERGAPEQWLPAYLTWFAAGIALALLQVLHERGRSARLVAPALALGRQPGSCWVLAGGLLLAAATPLAGPTMLGVPTPGQSLTKNLLYAAAALVVVLSGVFAVPGRYASVMSLPLLRRLGWISYGVFCLHLLVLHLVMAVTGWDLFVGRGPAIWAITVLLSIVAGEAVYRFVERPSLALKDRRPWRGSRASSSGAGRAEAGASTSATSGTTQA